MITHDPELFTDNSIFWYYFDIEALYILFPQNGLENISLSVKYLEKVQCLTRIERWFKTLVENLLSSFTYRNIKIKFCFLIGGNKSRYSGPRFHVQKVRTNTMWRRYGTNSNTRMLDLSVSRRETFQIWFSKICAQKNWENQGDRKISWSCWESWTTAYGSYFWSSKVWTPT